MSAVFFTVCYIVYLSCGALGAPTQSWQPPLDDKVAMRETLAPSWVSAPRTRGTFEILYSCTFTLALCVYTAIHLNVRGPEESQFTFYRRKTKWVLIALFAPEVVLYTAWFQWYQARQYCKIFNWIVDEFKRKANTTNAPSIPVSSEPVKDISTTQITGDNNRPRVNPDETTKTPPSSIRYMTLLDGFYAVMGGFVVDLPEAGRLRSTITPEGILRLADRDVFCMVSHQTIQDKSKADVLAKILVCFQVSFLVIQSSARKAGGYPLTLLEVHTLVHVICALLMYALWFRKPLNIQDPTVVETTDEVKECFEGEAPDDSKYLRSRARNIIVFTQNGGFPVLFLFFGLMTLCAAYGGVHLSAWNFHFPTKAEHYLWKAACITATCGSVAAPAWTVYSSDSDTSTVYKPWQTFIRTMNASQNYIQAVSKNPEFSFKYVMFILLVPSIIIGFVGTPFFFLARVAIVMEAFISLRSVPAGAYVAVGWTNFIPHV